MANQTSDTGGPKLIRSDLDNTREDERYDVAPAPRRFPEVTPDGEHSVGGGFDRFGLPDPAKQDGGADYLLDQDNQAAREEVSGQPINPEIRAIDEDRRPTDRHDESAAVAHQIDEEAEIDRHADRENQVRRDEKSPTNDK